MHDVKDRVIAAPSETSLTIRLASFAAELEAAGLPWSADRIRDVAGMVQAEREFAEALRR
jgi:hypothetical protein